MQKFCTCVTAFKMPFSQLSKEVDTYGNMSWNAFVDYCHDFIKISNNLNDGWIFKSERNSVNEIGESYLMKKTVKHSENDKLTKLQSKCDVDSMCFVDRNSVTFWEYHVLYSPSYCVPTLYFNAWKRDGSILTVDEITRLRETSGSSSNRIFVMSQQEHPLLHRPFYYIHPCDTSAIFQSCKTIMTNVKNINPITTWLSTLSSVAQLDLPLEYACSQCT